jgi:hypothetical protein
MLDDQTQKNNQRLILNKQHAEIEMAEYDASSYEERKRQRRAHVFGLKKPKFDLEYD